ncbi:TPA: helix-turn-helix domain-containing protein [Stenotrophomonas maltophilia]|nr:helix-turn-helix domain-containing protein [Stenotrophomonas maltophilia]
MNLIDIGKAVRARREELGLSQVQLAHLSGLSRQTVVGLERGTLNDLGVNRVGQLMAVLGLDVPAPTTENRLRKQGLKMAAQTANVSYASELTAGELARVLVSGEVPATYGAQVAHLLDEAPPSMMVMAVEEAAIKAQVAPRSVWRNVAKMACTLSAHRRNLWT